MLTTDQLREIRDAASRPGANVSAIARRFNISRAAVWKIREGKGQLGEKLTKEQAREHRHTAVQGAQGIAWLVEGEAWEGSGTWHAIERGYLTDGVFQHDGQVYSVDEALAAYQRMMDTLSDF